MSNICSFCGSSFVPDMLTCSACGALISTITVDEEMRAVDELVKHATQLALSGDEERVRTFWISSFTPSSTAAGSKMIAQLLGLMALDEAETESDLMPRARAIVTHLKLSGDGVNIQQVKLIEEELDRVDASRAEHQRKENRSTLLTLLIGLPVFAGIVFFAMFGDLNDDFPASMIGTYSNKSGSTLTITASGMSLDSGTSLTYVGDAKVRGAASISVPDDNTVQLTAVHGEWSSWSGYKTCSGGINRVDGTLMMTFSGEKLCQQFSGSWKRR